MISDICIHVTLPLYCNVILSFFVMFHSFINNKSRIFTYSGGKHLRNHNLSLFSLIAKA